MDTTSYKFAIILNKKNDIGKVINTSAHLSAALVAKASEEEKARMNFIDYVDADGGIHPISGCSLIILRADNSNKIRQARIAAQENNISFIDFTETMTKDTYHEQLERTKATKEELLDYWGIAMFAPSDILAPITKKFSLWQ